MTDLRPSLSDLLSAEKEAMVRPAGAAAQSLEAVQAALAQGRPPIVDVPPPAAAGSGWVAKLALIVGVVVVGVGVAVGVGGGFTTESPAAIAQAAEPEDSPVPEVEDEPPASAPIPEEAEPLEAGPDPPPPVAVDPPASTTEKPRRSNKPRREPQEAKAGNDALAEEFRLIRDAKRAANAGRRQAALGVLQTHAKRFPSGELAQERRALRVQLLCAMGRNSEAESARRSFERDYPASPHKERIASACR